MAKVGRMVKEQMLQDMTATLQAHQDFFVTTVGPLQAGETDLLRKRLRAAKAEMRMVKRRLGTRVFSSLNFDGAAAELLNGSVALIVAHEDVVSVAKLIAETAKANPEKLIIRGGRISGQFLSQSRVQELASLPSKLQLIANLIATIESPISDLIFVLEQAPSDVVWTLEEASKKAPVAPAA